MTETATPTDHRYLNFWLWACLRDGEAYLAASRAKPAPADVQAFEHRRLELKKSKMELKDEMHRTRSADLQAFKEMRLELRKRERELKEGDEAFEQRRLELKKRQMELKDEKDEAFKKRWSELKKCEKELKDEMKKCQVELRRERQLATYHFVSAVGSLIRNLKRSKKLFSSIKPACNKAKHLFAEGKLLRDMIEHADDYLQGIGQKQEGFVREFSSVKGFPEWVSGSSVATGTIVVGGHWLGGRLNVERVMAEVRVIADQAALIPVPPRPVVRSVRRTRPGKKRDF